jgi:DedD protein
MAKQSTPTEDEQNLRRKARRRLVGALALSLIVVVVLPMILDSEPKPAGQDIDLRIPDPEKAGAFVPKVVAPSAAPPETAASAVVPTPAPAMMPAAEPVAPAAPPVVAEKKDTGKTDAGKPAAHPPEKQAASAEPAAAASFVVQVGAYHDAERAQQLLANLKKWSFKAYAEKTADTVRIRVGPYRERDKAEKVKSLLEKHGLQPVIVPAS